MREVVGPDVRSLMRTIWQVTQAAVVFLALGILIRRRAQAMEYSWQWDRVRPFFHRVIDDEIVWGPLFKGLIQTLKLATVSGVIAVSIGFVTNLARFSNSIVGRIIAT